MIVKCPKCAAETDIGPEASDLSDIRYKLTCPEIHAQLAAAGGSKEELHCLYMRKARDAAILEFRHKQRRRAYHLKGNGLYSPDFTDVEINWDHLLEDGRELFCQEQRRNSWLGVALDAAREGREPVAISEQAAQEF